LKKTLGKKDKKQQVNFLPSVNKLTWCSYVIFTPEKLEILHYFWLSKGLCVSAGEARRIHVCGMWRVQEAWESSGGSGCMSWYEWWLRVKERGEHS